MARLQSLRSSLQTLRPKVTARPTQNRTTTSYTRMRGGNWMRLRLIALQRTNFLCTHCLNHGTTRLATVVDHNRPLHLGGSDQLSNLQPLCDECHSIKSAQEERVRGALWGRRVNV